jgi:hypothetical protein
LFYQQPGQFPGGILVADIGPGAQPVQIIPLGQQIGQFPGGVLVAGGGPARRICATPSRSPRSTRSTGARNRRRGSRPAAATSPVFHASSRLPLVPALEEGAPEGAVE